MLLPSILNAIGVLFLILLPLISALSSSDSSKNVKSNSQLLQQGEGSRRRFNQDLALSSICGFALRCDARECDEHVSGVSQVDCQIQEIAYATLSLAIPNFDCSIPVAMWFPTKDSDVTSKTTSEVRYIHRISVKRIGGLLAAWDFIPEFVSRDFAFEPSIDTLSSPIPKAEGCNVVFFAHGYLGSRFDLSHIAEALAMEGFVCISPEYPESLAASYARQEGLDRSIINEHLLSYVQKSFRPVSYAGIGHSLGCGTILRMGDDSWTRVIMAGRAPAVSSSPLLFISSTNDCTVRFGGPLEIPTCYSILSESELPLNHIPPFSALIFDRPDGPNHISYLSENVNEAMTSFLSPLLPLAQAFSIPVLDFDKYQKSRDSRATAEIVQPLISSFLAQHTNSKVQLSSSRRQQKYS
ncbi:unnamed protein product [Cylindrotheca closterium]|uniref:1-alkyl-2-acetylglycerophosphocholine esterase n=1 Tax=Cylindrotheca closterium TaxID=2856 RepID=A0AAD2FDS0_9STRA|nr:unnamed protein product [Cylindrotheca closterium]